MIELTTIKKQIELHPKMYQRCCHIGRPSHCCEGSIQQEHSFGRICGGNKLMHSVIVPVCSSMNYSPSAEDKAWSRIKTFEYYTIEQLKNKIPQKDWDAEIRLAKSFF